MEAFDDQAKSLYLPYGTALRMGELGYSSDAQKDLNVCYNSLDDYVDTLSSAIKQQHPAYSDIPSGQEGNYQQLNDSLLQIENEFYSSIRPKRVANSGETPLCALVRAGIEYIEVRSVDINPFSPVGLDDTQMRSLDTFLLYCLLQDSPACNDEEQLVQNANLKAVVNTGRQPGLQLNNGSDDIPMVEWANALLGAMRPIAEMLDTAHESGDYIASLDCQLGKVADPELTPSARILKEMHDKKLPFFRLAMAYSEKWAQYFRGRTLSADVQIAFEEEAQRSLLAQREYRSVGRYQLRALSGHLLQPVRGALGSLAVNFLAHFHLAWARRGPGCRRAGRGLLQRSAAGGAALGPRARHKITPRDRRLHGRTQPCATIAPGIPSEPAALCRNTH